MVRRAAAIAFAAGMVAGAAQGADLRIGVSEAATTIDPHHHFVRANNEIRHHIFLSLTWLDRNGRLWPLLATKWEPISDTTWRFKLRKKVNFRDGSPAGRAGCRLHAMPHTGDFRRAVAVHAVYLRDRVRKGANSPLKKSRPSDSVTRAWFESGASSWRWDDKGIDRWT